MKCDVSTQSEINESPRNTSVCRPSLVLAWQMTWTKTHSCRWSGRTVSESPNLLLATTDQRETLGPEAKQLHCYYQRYNYLTPSYKQEHYAIVTCEIKFQNYFSVRQRLCEIILFQRVETYLKLLQNYITGLLQLTNIFQHVRFRTASTAEIILFQFQTLHVK